MSSSRASRGCLMCRTRKVKCDELKPSCTRCIQRKELCTGYRNPQNLFTFRSENEKAASLSLKSKKPRRQSSNQELSASSSQYSKTGSLSSISSTSVDDADLEISSLAIGDQIGVTTPWLKKGVEESAEQKAVDSFFENYVLWPCNEGSSPGFLEQLPCLFEEVQREGRMALRWAVRAVGFASLRTELLSEEVEAKDDLAARADTCYGKALKALGETLRDKEEAVSDYTLMTIVVLDIFEALFIPTPHISCYGSHTQGMSQILRLRGPDQLYSARGWSLYRLATHRIQRQQLSFSTPLAPQITTEQEMLLGMLNTSQPFAQISNNNLHISKVCERARLLTQKLNVLNTEMGITNITEIINEMHTLDKEAISWRKTPAWEFTTIKLEEINGLSYEELRDWPPTIQIHKDIWITYEWNYHRTGRLLLHTQILGCLKKLAGEGHGRNDLTNLTFRSREIISGLVDEVLSTVPQSLGDVDGNGGLVGKLWKGEVRMKGVGAYFLLWPVKIVKGSAYVTKEQRELAEKAFERIRVVSGMKEALGMKSCV